MGDGIWIDAGPSSGGRSAPHGKRSLRVLVASTTEQAYNLLRPALVPIACWSMEDVRFGFDSSFVRPEARKEMGALREAVATHPGSPLTIFGHADPTGDELYNKVLSGRRASAIHGMLLREVDSWVHLYDQPHGRDAWGLAEVETMLACLPGPTGFPYYTGPCDGRETPAVHAALRAFQGAEGLPQSGANDAPSRRGLFRKYMDFLCTGDAPDQILALTPEDFLARGADPDGRGDVQGCSEFNPVLVFSEQATKDFQKPGHESARDAANACNRRVVAFLFDKGVKVSPANWPCPTVKEGVDACKVRFWSDADARVAPTADERRFEDTADTFACRFYQRFAHRSPCECSGNVKVFRVRMCDHNRDPMPEARYKIRNGSFEAYGVADSAGCIEVRAARRPEICEIFYSAKDTEGDDYNLVIRFYTLVGEGDESVRRRLYNLGFRMHPTLEGNIIDFQLAFKRAPTGKVVDVEGDVVSWHDGGSKPMVLG